ncbi:hypothetical protein N0V86_009738 [Didymella sp. IMI 355093]|nr:hypothetical protein N0V86_009738 [Didymella sp. IMI 355093]
MADFNPFAFTRSRILQPSSTDASMRIRSAKLERENATLQRELSNANDANGVARAIAACQAACRDKVNEAQRETTRTQMAEKIARDIADELRNTLVMAEGSTADQEEVVKLKERQEQSPTENGKPQVESATDRGLPVNAPDNAGGINNIHAECQHDRVELIKDFQNLCLIVKRDHANQIAALQAANDKLEAANKTNGSWIETLEDRLTDKTERLEQLQKEVQQSTQAVELAESLKGKLHSREAELEQLLEERAVENAAETSKINEQQQKQLQGVESPLKAEIQGLKYEIEGYENELDKVRSENITLQLALGHRKEVEKHLNENNERLLADLQDGRDQRRSLTIERDKFEVQLAETEGVLQETAQREVDLQRELELFRSEFESAAEGAVQQQLALREEVESLITQVGEHASGVAARDQRMETLQRENKALKSQYGVLKSQNEILEESKKASLSQLAKNSAQELALGFTPRPNYNRSVSMASHISLAEELGFDDDRSDRSSSEDEYMQHFELKLSQVKYISTAPRELVKPQLTVSVGDAVATTPRIRQDSPLEHSPMDTVQPSLDVFEHTVADFAPTWPVDPALTLSGTTVGSLSPFEPKPASLAVSNITSVDCAPIEAQATSTEQFLQVHVEEASNFAPVEPASRAAPSPQQLTMHVFNHSVISVDPKSGSVIVTDLHTDRARSICDLSKDMDRLGLLRPENLSHRQDIPTQPPAHLKYDCFSSSRMDSNINRDDSTSSRRKHSSFKQYPRNIKLSDAHDLDLRTGVWPCRDLLTTSNPRATINIEPVPDATISWGVPTVREKVSESFAHILVALPILLLGAISTSLLPDFLVLFEILLTSLLLRSALYKPLSVTSRNTLDPRAHYLLHALLMPLTFFCWRVWSQVHAWEHANGVGFGEGFGGAYDDSGPYGNGHYILSKLPLNLMSADSHLPSRAVEVITSTVSAFEGLIGLGPTLSF